MSKRARFVTLYLLLVILPLAGLLIVLKAGRGLHAKPGNAVADSALVAPLMQNGLRVTILLMQVIVIIVASRVVGALLGRFRQPQVVGEMLAGILLGPSLLGAVAPAVYQNLFPTGSLRFLNALSQIGLLLFMFLVGVELDLRFLRERGHAAILTSHASITAPLFLGSGLAIILYPRLSDSSVPFFRFALFLGVAMSITAFPVLARILAERGLQSTPLGSTVIACAAVDDVTAWCLLATVVAIAREGTSSTHLWLTMAGLVAFVLFMVGIVRPLLAAAYRRAIPNGLSQHMVGGIIVVILASALTTEWLGIHALFGAFLAGVIMPREISLLSELQKRFEDVLECLLLPLFFAYTGLRMSIGLLQSWELWLLCLAVLATAVAGKFGGSTLAAGLSGVSWREASVIGALMNTRGLVELIVLNVGLDLKVISPTLFTMMVLMTLITTLMTTPFLEWLYPATRKMQRAQAADMQRVSISRSQA
jgi:Kef-type K+ transport system membrane component KefB